jgi:hypothetical protein
VWVRFGAPTPPAGPGLADTPPKEEIGMPRSDRAPTATEIAAFEEAYQDHRRELDAIWAQGICRYCGRDDESVIEDHVLYCRACGAGFTYDGSQTIHPDHLATRADHRENHPRSRPRGRARRRVARWAAAARARFCPRAPLEPMAVT